MSGFSIGMGSGDPEDRPGRGQYLERCRLKLGQRHTRPVRVGKERWAANTSTTRNTDLTAASSFSGRLVVTTSRIRNYFQLLLRQIGLGSARRSHEGSLRACRTWRSPLLTSSIELLAASERKEFLARRDDPAFLAGVRGVSATVGVIPVNMMRLMNSFFKEVGDALDRVPPVLRLLQLLPYSPHDSRDHSNASRHHGSRLELLS
jgi:hypothetical protein